MYLFVPVWWHSTIWMARGQSRYQEYHPTKCTYKMEEFIYTKIKCLFVKCALFVLFPNLTENWRNVVNRARSFALKQCTPIFLFFRHYHSCSWIYHCVPEVIQGVQIQNCTYNVLISVKIILIWVMGTKSLKWHF